MKAKAKFTRLMPMSVWVEFIVFNFRIVSWLLLDHMYCYQKYCIAIRNKCFSKPISYFDGILSCVEQCLV